MFECAMVMLTQLIKCFPMLLGLYLLFYFIGGLLFKE